MEEYFFCGLKHRALLFLEEGIPRLMNRKGILLVVEVNTLRKLMRTEKTIFFCVPSMSLSVHKIGD